MKSKIYTRNGDKGLTTLVGGKKVSKTNIRIEAYGTIDELNAFIGLLISLLTDEHDLSFLYSLQKKLFVVGAQLATDTIGNSLPSLTVEISDKDVRSLEQEIDDIDAQLPPLQAFVLPGGGQAAAVCHVCRTICRRAERRILSLSETRPVSSELLSFINRLSDYLFVLSRKISLAVNQKEIFW